MKYRLLALLLAASALTAVRAQDQDQQQQKPPTEIPDFSNLDEYIYEPRSTVRLGFRHLSGAKTQFSGTGSIIAPVDPEPGLGGYYYHDGSVRADTRTTPRVDASGNPMIDPQNGATINDPIAPDGKTNTWTYIDSRQVDNAPLGYIQFHTYSADVTNIGTQAAQSRSTNGLDLTVERDMGKLWGGRLSWNILGGMSINDISAKKLSAVSANVSTTTSMFSLNGQNAPGLPSSGNGYSAPTTSTQTITDSQGNTQTVSVADSPLLSANPVWTSDPVITNSLTAVVNNWKVKGAYYTFRGGAELVWNITSKLKLQLSAGPVIIYSGTTYTVDQTFTPDIGAAITEADTTSANKIRIGYYGDATLQYDVTDKAGFFAGAIFQSAGSYTQELNTTTARYATKVDLANQNGLRAGMSVRF